MKICPHCRSQYPDDAQFCAQCQSPLTYCVPYVPEKKSSPVKGILLAVGIVLVAALLVFAVLTARHIICLRHDYSPATCTKARVCKLCQKAEGAPLGHDWEDATCTAPKTCSRCSKTKDSALGHTWEDATCLTAKTCRTCKETDGAPLGHNWKAASCTETQQCLTCGTLGDAATGHIPGDWVTVQEPTLTESGKSTLSCTVCGETVDTLHENKKEIEIHDYNFNFKDEEFISYINSVGEVMISPKPLDASEYISDPSISVYRATLQSYDSTLMMLYHDADGYVCAIACASGDYGLACVTTIALGRYISDDITLEEAAQSIAENQFYATDELAIVAVDMSEDVYAALLAPIPYILDMLE